MQDFLFSLNVTGPVFLVIILGWFLGKIGLFTEGFTSVADKYVFKVALPVLLFEDIAAMDLKSDFSVKFVLFCVIATTVMFGACWLGARLFLKDKSMVGAFAQAAARGSAAVLGIAFVQNIYGDAGMTPMMIVAAVPLFNIYSVLILTFSAESGSRDTGKVKKALVNVAKNPIILGILAGVVWNLAGLPMPTILSKAVSQVANTATPIALLVLGATFRGRDALAKLGPTAAATFIKLIAIPAVFFPIAIALGFRDSELVAFLIMLASPTTVTCYIMAKNMDNDAVLSASVVMCSTLFSSVTLTFWVFLMRTMGYI
jgi:hypothetical protein